MPTPSTTAQATLEQDVRDRNVDMLVSLWRHAQAGNDGEVMLRFNCPLSVIEALRGMTYNQVRRAASVSTLQWRPTFDASRLIADAGPAMEPGDVVDLDTEVLAMSSGVIR